jgi:hypothetical protein
MSAGIIGEQTSILDVRLVIKSLEPLLVNPGVFRGVKTSKQLVPMFFPLNINQGSVLWRNMASRTLAIKMLLVDAEKTYPSSAGVIA